MDIASRIDHTLLKPTATRRDIVFAAQEALRFGCASCCVNPRWTRIVSAELAGSAVATCSVVGFPLGASPSSITAAETKQAINDGATEIDMVIDLGSLRAGEDHAVIDDIAEVVEAAAGRTVKVICESHLLDDAEIVRACAAVRAGGAHFIKTCTGFSGGGATGHAVRLMRHCVGSDVRIKASGGIRDLPTAQAMLAAGADRLGCSATAAILAGTTSTDSY